MDTTAKKAPLRKVVRAFVAEGNRHFDYLECGHRYIWPPICGNGFHGGYAAKRRRCVVCKVNKK
jgi:hypothetical protein